MPREDPKSDLHGGIFAYRDFDRDEKTTVDFYEAAAAYNVPRGAVLPPPDRYRYRSQAAADACAVRFLRFLDRKACLRESLRR